MNLSVAIVTFLAGIVQSSDANLLIYNKKMRIRMLIDRILVSLLKSARSWQGRLNGRFERRLFHVDSSINNVLRQLAALAALRCYTEFLANLSKRAGSAIDEFLDLAISDCFAKTYVHSLLNRF